MDEIYEIPDSVHDLFQEVAANGEAHYRIINTNEGMDMDNVESMAHFLYCVEVPEEFVERDDYTQVILKHPDYDKKIVVDAGGLGDFNSHSFDCKWYEE
ncbi:hypothetical protein [Shouchella tritolerans]|uniref:hypothetical protein n=1 Tax=Shouchella tritolerans TaxID=2979466 RepID=UPI0021E6DB79|nr:hypothetical protein [Shouchella tritolerans]